VKRKKNEKIVHLFYHIQHMHLSLSHGVFLRVLLCEWLLEHPFVVHHCNTYRDVLSAQLLDAISHPGGDVKTPIEALLPEAST